MAYCTNAELLAEIAASRAKGQISSELGRMLMLMVEKISRMPRWKDYSFLDEMRDNAIEMLVSGWFKFDEARSQNPFSYYTSIVQNAFVKVLRERQRASEARRELVTWMVTPTVLINQTVQFGPSDNVLPEGCKYKRKPGRKAQEKPTQPVRYLVKTYEEIEARRAAALEEPKKPPPRTVVKRQPTLRKRQTIVTPGEELKLVGSAVPCDSGQPEPKKPRVLQPRNEPKRRRPRTPKWQTVDDSFLLAWHYRKNGSLPRTPEEIRVRYRRYLETANRRREEPLAPRWQTADEAYLRAWARKRAAGRYNINPESPEPELREQFRLYSEMASKRSQAFYRKKKRGEYVPREKKEKAPKKPPTAPRLPKWMTADEEFLRNWIERKRERLRQYQNQRRGSDGTAIGRPRRENDSIEEIRESYRRYLERAARKPQTVNTEVL